jgi:hypothetical protein
MGSLEGSERKSMKTSLRFRIPVNRWCYIGISRDVIAKTLTVMLAIGLAVSSVACMKSGTASTPNAPLVTAAKIDADYAKALATVQSVARAAHETKKADGTPVLSDANYAIWLNIALRLNQGGQQVSAFIRAQATLDPAARTKASAVIANLAKTIQDAISTDLIRIGDANLRNQIQGALALAQATLNSAGIALAVGGN